MEEVLGRLRTLTSDQLRQEILAAGLKCGPITATTRALFERKLARSLLENDGSASDGANRGSAGDKEEGAGHDPRLSSEEGKGEEVAAPCGEVEESPSESPPVYYGVCPQQDESSGTDKVHVFVDWKKALRAAGALKDARFKSFSTREEAEEFSKGTGERILVPVSTPDGPQRNMEPPELTGTPPLNSEKANEFHSPRTQDLTAKLRKSVEQGDQEAFTRLVWENPRYLIGSGDNPTIVHEGCHYNVLHVAAKENQAGMARVLLDTLESPAFMRLMYPEDQETMLHQRISFIVDLYLNTPDKTNNDTPLHYACKFGCAEVVNVLCSHPITDKHRRNKYSQKPSNVICERKNKTPDIRRRIKEYLEDRCYVPLLRGTDNSFQPVIGLPWSPGTLEESHLQPVGSGPEGSPIDPVRTMRAFVGPLSPSKAKEFYRLWRTPPRERAEYVHRILKSDPDRGVERVGREIAHDMGHAWAEYWDFLDSFVDLSTEEGLKRLEEHLDRKEDSTTPQHNNNNNSPNRGTDAAVDSPQRTPSPKAEKKSSVSPVCNLLSEFEKAGLVDGSLSDQERQTSETGPEEKGLDLTNGSFWRMWGWRQKQGKQKQEQRQEEEELSSCCSEDYLTADDGSECSDHPGEDGRDRKDSVSSYSSCQSTGDTTEDTTLIQEPSTSQAMFIEGDSPSRVDREVLCAVERIHIDPERFPCVSKWRNTVLTYPSPQRLSWPSPAQKQTETQGSSPSSLSSPSGLLSPGTLLHRRICF